MDSIEIPYLYTPREYQLPLFESFNSGRCNRALLRWSRRAGKELTCIAYTVQAMFQRPGIYYYFFPTYSQGRKVLWEGKDKAGIPFLDRIPKQWVKRRLDQQQFIELHNGSIFRVVGSDDYDSIIGTNPVGMVFSEWAYSREGAWNKMSPILAENGGWAIFNSTPNGENHMFKMESKVKSNPKWLVSVVQSLWPDKANYWPVIQQSEIAQERDSGKEESILEQEYGVSYVAGVQGAYYSDHIEEARKSGRIGTYIYNSHLPVNVYSDLGLTDDTVLWFSQNDGNRIIFFDYYEDSGRDLGHYAKILKEKGYRYNEFWMPHDGKEGVLQTALSNKEAFRRYCAHEGVDIVVRCSDRVANKQLAINAVRSRFPRYHFDQHACALGIEKLNLYHRQYDEAHRCFKQVPTHDWTSHAADGLSTEALTAKFHDGYSSGKLVLPDIITDFDPRG